jgi:hypothetical protein
MNTLQLLHPTLQPNSTVLPARDHETSKFALLLLLLLLLLLVLVLVLLVAFPRACAASP